MSHLKKNDVSLGGVVPCVNVVFEADFLFAVVFEVLGLRIFLQSSRVFALKCVVGACFWRFLTIESTAMCSSRPDIDGSAAVSRALRGIRRRRLGGSVF